MGPGPRFAGLVFATLLLLSPAFAQLQPTSPPPVKANPSAGENILNFFSARTPYEFWLTLIIGIFGLVVITTIIFTLRRMPNVRPEDVTRPVVVVTIITGTLILMSAGYSNEQVAPAFGLFGTIVGYILGRLGQPSAPIRDDGAATNAATNPP